jgi:hypothetical protein
MQNEIRYYHCVNQSRELKEINETYEYSQEGRHG